MPRPLNPDPHLKRLWAEFDRADSSDDLIAMNDTANALINYQRTHPQPPYQLPKPKSRRHACN